MITPAETGLTGALAFALIDRAQPIDLSGVHEPPAAPAMADGPLAGWLRSIRAALGLSAAALAARLEITASGLRKLEQAEAQDAITLATLRRVAAAMDCELQQALRLARQFQQRADRTMTLEAQQKTT